MLFWLLIYDIMSYIIILINPSGPPPIIGGIPIPAPPLDVILTVLNPGPWWTSFLIWLPSAVVFSSTKSSSSAYFSSYSSSSFSISSLSSFNSGSSLFSSSSDFSGSSDDFDKSAFFYSLSDLFFDLSLFFVSLTIFLTASGSLTKVSWVDSSTISKAFAKVNY